MEERDDVVVLIDEDGKEVEFEHLDTIELNENEYVILVPLDESEDTEDDVDEVVILKIEHNESGDDSFVSVDDEEELDKVFEEFKQRMEDDYDVTE
jgi:uncharacterized protein YrzB (UPF0473 family)